jgi:demethylmenaquinone methyltransferase/2-methoxy-6-polyprenyl-1,4-benzoquinol methylase
MKTPLPIEREKEQARAYYDRLSSIYDFLTRSEAAIIRQGVDLLSVTAGETVLEIGSGTGTALEMMATRLGEGRCLVGLDLSGEMLIKSQEKLTAAQTALVQADAAHLPLKKKRFDAVFCAFTLELFSVEDIPVVLDEIHRVLKPGGRLTLVTMAQTPRNLAVRLYETAHRLFPVAIDCRPIPLLDILAETPFKVESHQKLLNWGLPIHLVLAFIPG